MVVVALVLALIAGGGMAVHAGANAELARWAGSPILGALLSFAVGLVVLVALAAIQHRPLPSFARLGHAPWWAWLGGFLGAAYIIFANIAVPRLGIAAFAAAVIAAQMFVALLVDRLGWLGVHERAITPGRAVGALLLVAGVACVRIF